MAFPPGNGAVLGKYKVTVSKMIDPPVVPFDESAHDAPPPKISKPKSLIPVKYSQPHTSNLIAEVPAEGTESLKIELKDLPSRGFFATKVINSRAAVAHRLARGDVSGAARCEYSALDP